MDGVRGTCRGIDVQGGKIRDNPTPESFLIHALA